MARNLNKQRQVNDDFFKYQLMDKRFKGALDPNFLNLTLNRENCLL